MEAADLAGADLGRERRSDRRGGVGVEAVDRTLTIMPDKIQHSLRTVRDMLANHIGEAGDQDIS